MNRVLRACAAAVVAVSIPLMSRAAPPPPAAAAKPHNIIFVLVDDLRFDGMGFLRPGLKTPNIDFLAKNGVYFPNAVVTSSLCSPSRATILTGQTTRNHGVVDNNNSSEAGLVFFPTYLQAAGYQTAFFGKWHMGAATDAPRPGFDKWVSFKGQGTYSATEGLTPQDIAAGKRQTLNVDGKIVDRTGYMTDELSDYALDWLETGRDKSKPFFLYLSHKAVHSDAQPAARHVGQYADLDIKMPDSMADTPGNNRGKPMWVQNQRNSWHGVDFPYHSKRDLAAYFRTYFATLSAVDDNLGRTLAYLRKNKLEDNTLIVFTSDNGGPTWQTTSSNAPLNGVKALTLEGGVRVPAIFRWTGQIPGGRTVSSVAMGFDVTATALSFAGVPTGSDLDGVNLMPFLKGSRAGDAHSQLFWRMGPQGAMRQGPWKLVKVEDADYLFNLTTDIGERHDLAATDPQRLKTMQAAWQAWANTMSPARWGGLSRAGTAQAGELKTLVDRYVKGLPVDPKSLLYGGGPE